MSGDLALDLLGGTVVEDDAGDLGRDGQRQNKSVSDRLSEKRTKGDELTLELAALWH